MDEYIITVRNSGKSDVFRVYSHNEGLAVNTFVSACELYKDTDNSSHREYWNDMLDGIESKNYTIIKNEDFIGIRKVI